MRILFLFIALMFSQLGFALNQEEAFQLFDEANKAYQQEDYKKAHDLYLQIAPEFSSFELEYNLGNTYMKMDSIAPAILHYERARKINPYDDDLKTNLQLANQRVTDKIEALPTLGVGDLWKSVTSESSLRWWTWLTIGFLLLAMLLLSLYAWKRHAAYRRALFFGAGVFVMFSLSTWALGNASLNRIHQSSEAVIFSPKVDVKSSPSSDGTTVFVLHSGTKISIREQREEWFEIRIANGNVGWIKTSDLRAI